MHAPNITLFLFALAPYIQIFLVHTDSFHLPPCTPVLLLSTCLPPNLVLNINQAAFLLSVLKQIQHSWSGCMLFWVLHSSEGEKQLTDSTLSSLREAQSALLVQSWLEWKSERSVRSGEALTKQWGIYGQAEVLLGAAKTALGWRKHINNLIHGFIPTVQSDISVTSFYRSFLNLQFWSTEEVFL